MMIEIKNQNFRVGPFIPVLMKVSRYPKFKGGTLFTVMKTLRAIEKAKDDWADIHLKLVEQFASKGEDGKIFPRKDDEGKEIPNSFDVAKDKQAEWEKQLEALDKEVSKVDRAKIPLAKLLDSGLELSPQECMILEPILDDAEPAE